MLPDFPIAHLSSLSPDAIYLFGSLASGRGRSDSDLDIAFLSDRPSDPLELFDLASRIASEVGREVDLIDLRRANTVFAKQVIVTGRRILDRNPRLRMEFEMRTLSDYARLNEERQPVLRKLALHQHTRQ